MIKLLFIFGTRPEAIKLAPVIQYAQKVDGIDAITCSTGQHKEMLAQVIDFFNLNIDYCLNVMTSNQSLSDLTSKLSQRLDHVITQVKPDWVIVQGDTTTCFVGSLIAFYHKTKVAHVEAGLRTYNLHSPFPEELNRQLVSKIANIHFAPTKLAEQNLLSEGVDKKKVLVTGNTVIDAIQIAKSKVFWKDAWQKNIGVVKDLIEQSSKYFLLTVHRRENQGEGMLSIFSAIKVLAESSPSIHFIFPVHLSPKVRESAYALLRGMDNIHLVEPLGYDEMVYCLKHCFLVLTDSGGIQEEAPAFGKPILVLRNTTERPEGVEAGVAKLIGTDEDDIC